MWGCCKLLAIFVLEPVKREVWIVCLLVKNLLLFVFAVGLTVASGLYQRPSGELGQYGNQCSVDDWMHCYQPVESAGFPFAYGFDTPGVSVEHQVALFEDEFRWLPFCVNAWFYYLLLFFSLRMFKERGSNSTL